jgi:protein-disulfide isomerase
MQKDHQKGAANILVTIIVVGLIAGFAVYEVDKFFMGVSEKTLQDDVKKLTDQVAQKDKTIKALRNDVEGLQQDNDALFEQLRIRKSPTAEKDAARITSLEKQVKDLKAKVAECIASGGSTQGGTTTGGGERLPESYAKETPFLQELADDDPVIGAADSKVTMLVFCDFESRLCKRFKDEIYEPLADKYVNNGKMKYVYRDYPLTAIHAEAMNAAIAADCANEQKKYWAYSNKLFENQDSFGAAAYKQWAVDIGLNAGQFNQCYDSQKYKTEVEHDLADGIQVGVSGVPSVFINSFMVTGLSDISVYESMIEKELERTAKLTIPPPSGT